MLDSRTSLGVMKVGLKLPSANGELGVRVGRVLLYVHVVQAAHKDAFENFAVGSCDTNKQAKLRGQQAKSKESLLELAAELKKAKSEMVKETTGDLELSARLTFERNNQIGRLTS